MCFSPYLGVAGGGGGKGSRAHNLLVQLSGLGSSKMEISETDFFDTLTIQNDQISYVKHVLAPLPSRGALPKAIEFFWFCWVGGSARSLPPHRWWSKALTQTNTRPSDTLYSVIPAPLMTSTQ